MLPANIIKIRPKSAGQNFPQTLRQLFRMKCRHCRQQEKYSRVDQLPESCLRSIVQKRKHCHLKRGAGCPGDGQAWSDRQIDQDGKNHRKRRMYLSRQAVKPSCPRNGYHSQHRKTNRAHQKARHGRPGSRPGLSR